MSAREAMLAVVDVLNRRRGFDDWWDSLDEDIRHEIEEALVLAIERVA